MFRYMRFQDKGENAHVTVQWTLPDERWVVKVDGETAYRDMSFDKAKYIYKYDAAEYARELAEKLAKSIPNVRLTIYNKSNKSSKTKVY